MKQIKFYEVYDLRALQDRESAVCYESLIDTLEEAYEAGRSYGGGVLYECEADVDDTTSPHTITEVTSRKIGEVYAANSGQELVTVKKGKNG